MMKRRAKVDYARWVFVLPALLVVGILLIYPIFSSLYYSMTTKHLIRLTYDFIGLENYKAVLALVWVLLCSVKSSGELTSNPTRFFPKHFTLENFTHVIQDLGFAKNIGNSLIIAIITTGIAIVISSMAAYGIVRFFPKLGSIMSKVLVATYMFPPILLAIPYSMVMAKLGLVNTRIGLII